jgi:hypothetical protein
MADHVSVTSRNDTGRELRHMRSVPGISGSPDYPLARCDFSAEDTQISALRGFLSAIPSG